MMLRRFMFVILVVAYGALFLHQEQMRQLDEPRLALPLPPAPLKSVLGYLRQLGGEMHFIKTCVFLGALDPSKPWDSYADNLGRNFDAMAELHPDFRDTYFLAESSLAHIGPQQARKANAILTIGIHTYPEEWLFPFFRGFNRFYYLKENRLAAEDLMAASKLPNGPPWLGHLGSMLLAEGGDIYTSLVWLRTMLQGEKDEAMKARYKNDIAAFEKAWAVQTAVFAYRKKYDQLPTTLDALVPEFLPVLPELGGDFVLVWNSPLLQVQRLHTANIAQ